MGLKYCMERKCKVCKKQDRCKQLDYVIQKRLTYYPFENLKKILEAKNGNMPR